MALRCRGKIEYHERTDEDETITVWKERSQVSKYAREVTFCTNGEKHRQKHQTKEYRLTICRKHYPLARPDALASLVKPPYWVISGSKHQKTINSSPQNSGAFFMKWNTKTYRRACNALYWCHISPYNHACCRPPPSAPQKVIAFVRVHSHLLMHIKLLECR